VDSEKIKSLCAVVETGSMSEAARILYCSQPAVTKHIAALESEFGVKIFQREGKRLLLTEAGRRIHAFASRFLDDYQQLQQALYHLRMQENHCINFGATNFIGTYLVPEALAAYKEAHPDRQVMVTIDFWSNLLQLLHRDEIAFALAPQTEELLNMEELEHLPVAEDAMCLILPPEHPLAMQEEISTENLREIPFLVPQGLSATRRYVMEQFESLGFTPHALLDLGTAQAVKQGVINGLGVGIVSRRSVRMEELAQRLVCRPVQGMHMTRTLCVVKRKDRRMTAEEAAWIETVRNLSV